MHADVTVLMELEAAPGSGRMHLPQRISPNLGPVLDFDFGHVPNEDLGCDHREVHDLDEPCPAGRHDAPRIACGTNEAARPGLLRTIKTLRLEIEWKIVKPAALVRQLSDARYREMQQFAHRAASPVFAASF